MLGMVSWFARNAVAANLLMVVAFVGGVLECGLHHGHHLAHDLLLDLLGLRIYLVAGRLHLELRDELLRLLLDLGHEELWHRVSETVLLTHVLLLRGNRPPLA